MTTSQSTKPAILVTGANGFVGSALCAALTARGTRLRRAVRSRPADAAPDDETVAVGSLGPSTDWSAALAGIQVVVHLAARVHVMQDTAQDPLAEFRLVNTEATRRLAEAAQAAGVRRLIYVSSIKVNGEATTRPFTELDTPDLSEPYAISKWEAEQLLLQRHQPGSFEVTIVRPPLVYGPGVGANFLQLIKLVDLGIPLPFGATGNLRSMVALANLCDLLITCIDHPAASGEVFLVSDGTDLSTTELVRRLAHHLQRRPLLLPVPRPAVELPARLLGKEALVLRLWGSLQVDTRKARTLLGWSPVLGVDEALERVVRWYRGLKG